MYIIFIIVQSKEDDVTEVRMELLGRVTCFSVALIGCSVFLLHETIKNVNVLLYITFFNGTVCVLEVRNMRSRTY